ncbi:MAG: ABC transporter permease [Candidatus Wallacebacter cryptica]|jgi:ABC-2 type transport system permease protein|nr:ABC transporter permease [Bacillota bacterium]
MKTLAFASRNSKEIIRDRINLVFGIGFPIVLLLLLTAIQKNVPVELFVIDQLIPGIAVFGLSFIALFSGTLIAKDRSSSLMARLFVSPLTARDFIFGYTLPLLPMAIMQVVVCYTVAGLLGLKITPNVLLALIVVIPTAVFFIAIGLLCGSLFNDKQVGGVCGALLTNLSGWFSGTWFDLELVGGTFARIANLLPFSHAVNAGRAALSGNYQKIMPHLWWVIGYAAITLAVAILVFTKKMSSDTP